MSYSTLAYNAVTFPGTSDPPSGGTYSTPAHNYATFPNGITPAVMNAAGGSYTLTGGGADLIFPRTLNAGTGAFTLAGGAANLAAGSYTMHGTAGVFTATGGAAHLAPGHYYLNAAEGAFNLTGGTARMVAQWTPLKAGAGAFVLAGGNARLGIPDSNASLPFGGWRLSASAWLGDAQTVLGYGGWKLTASGGAVASLSWGGVSLSATGDSTLLASASLEYGGFTLNASATLTLQASASLQYAGWSLSAFGGAQARLGYGGFTLAATATVERLARASLLYGGWALSATAFQDLCASAVLPFGGWGLNPGHAHASLAFGGVGLVATATSYIPPVYVGYSVNIRTGAVSRYTNYAVTRIFRFLGRYYGILANGNLAELAGDTDDGVPIQWVVRTGFLPDQGKLTRLTEAIFDGSETGDSLVRVVRNGQYVSPDYLLRAIPSYNDKHSARCKLGQGPEARHWQVEIQNINGAAREICSLEIHQAPTSKRIA
jgi:hypothetical protein